jgi:hypothetical protein
MPKEQLNRLVKSNKKLDDIINLYKGDYIVEIGEYQFDYKGTDPIKDR